MTPASRSLGVRIAAWALTAAAVVVATGPAWAEETAHPDASAAAASTTASHPDEAATPHPDHPADAQSASDGHGGKDAAGHDLAHSQAQTLVPAPGQTDWYPLVLGGIACLFLAAIVIGVINHALGIKDPGPEATAYDQAHDDHGHDHHGHDDHGHDSHSHGKADHGKH